ncbi:hypothetical protein ACTNDG_07220 [Clostridium sp. HCP1S3_B4]|uniref:hypothetical protein n=1 Tax=unclassified Clostridium TaxID=2614128 RepID=UPI002A7D46ED|nr:hypothetical protein [Clostridiales bacterium]MDY2728824.1 hypothetical protein [Clostridium sp.]
MSKINDSEVLRRFEIWSIKEPDEIYIDLNINSLHKYIAFIYYKYNLIVLDSIYSNNGYYFFYDYTINDLIDLTKNATKAEIFKIASMKKHGYHISNIEKLHGNIEKIFIRS